MHTGPDMAAGGLQKILPIESRGRTQTATDNHGLGIQYIDQEPDMRAQGLGSGLNHLESEFVASGGRKDVRARSDRPLAESVESICQGGAGGELFQSGLVHMSASVANDTQRTAGHGAGGSPGSLERAALEDKTGGNAGADRDVEELLERLSGTQSSLGEGGRAHIGLQDHWSSCRQSFEHGQAGPIKTTVAENLSHWGDELAKPDTDGVDGPSGLMSLECQSLDELFGIVEDSLAAPGWKCWDAVRGDECASGQGNHPAGDLGATDIDADRRGGFMSADTSLEAQHAEHPVRDR